MRITVNGKRSQISIKRKVDIEKWNSEAGKVIGKSLEVKELNRYLTSLEHRIFKIQQKLLDDNRQITALLIKNIFTGKAENQKMLLKIFQDHNNQVEKLVGRDFAPGTLERYKTARKHVQEYISLEYSTEDIAVKDVNHKFISGFEYYLKTETHSANHRTQCTLWTQVID